MRHLIFLAVCGLLAAGCTENERSSSSIRQRQDQALKDPFNYSPHVNEDSVGGGGTLDFKKDAFRRDVQHVFDP